MMKVMTAVAVAATMALSGCAGLPGLAAPAAAVAQHTAADEEARKRCEQTYKLSRTVMEIGVDAGLLTGTRATKAAMLDMEMFGALNVCRTAYMLFNGRALVAAANDMDTKADALSAAVQGGND